jgi:hypothetical protein
MQKNAKKHIKSKEKRPKAIDSSHNACRYGYPFFLSPSDDDAMLEIPNPTPSVHQTVRTFVCLFFSCAAPKRKETRLSKIPQQNKNSKTSENPTLHIFSQIPQNSKNIKITTQNYQITAKSMKI